MGILKAKLRMLLHKRNCKLSDVIKKGDDIIVYGFDAEVKSWGFWNYAPKTLGLGKLTPLEVNLSREDAIFKKNILLLEVQK